MQDIKEIMYNKRRKTYMNLLVFKTYTGSLDTFQLKSKQKFNIKCFC